MGVAEILTWNQVGANWPHHIFYGQLVPSGALWPFGLNTFSFPLLATIIIYGLRPYPAIIGLLGQFPYHQPAGLYLSFWAWGSFSLPGGLGHLAPYGFYGPRSVGQLGPFWPNPMRPKGGNHLAPKPQLGPPEPILATNPLDPNLAKNPLDTKMAIEPIGPIFGHGTPWTIIPAMASGNHQTSSASTPLNLRGILSIPPCTLYSRLQE
ncbi:hypothetical protein O181_116349, partial [Austropuccinia psidii MF-1]|nr:hypothetical protein [Austropuccinia psidii MF-1]